MSQLSINVPGTPEGADVEVPGLGVFPNGSCHTLSTEQMKSYELHNRHNHDVKWPLIIGEPLASRPVEKKKTSTAPAAVEGSDG